MKSPRKPRVPDATARQKAGPREQDRHQGKAEEKYHGLRACESIYAHRPQDIIRVYLADERRRHLSKLLDFCARERKGFQVVAHDNLQRITGSIHHEGIAILAREVRRWDSADLMRSLLAGQHTGPLLYLDGVHNPHNLGSIVRVASHFGVTALLGAQDDLPPLSPAAVRVAEGGAEHVSVYGIANPTADLKRLKELGYRIVATSGNRGDVVYAAPLAGKIVVVLGSEGVGISRDIEALADQLIRIPGTGVVRSLNVSVACGILLSEVWRRGQK